MATGRPTPGHIELTETMVRLYVFLAQELDRCLDEAARQSFPEAELQKHLAATRSQLLDIVQVNPVVKGKVEQEWERVLSLAATCLKGGPDKDKQVGAVKAERAILKNKTIALSDLLAVFRAL
jgi:hypothetical protein